MGVISYIKEEIKVVKERDPAIKSDIEVLLYPSFKVMLHYRIAHKLYLKKHYFLARKNRNRDPSGSNHWKGAFYRPWKWRYHRRDCNPG